MKDLQYFKDELARSPGYQYESWNDMVVKLGHLKYTEDLISQRLALSTFNYASQFTSKHELVQFIKDTI
jgi:hypothetical protein